LAISDLAIDPEQKFGMTSVETVFFLLMFLSIIGGCVSVFNGYWLWVEERNQ